MTTRTALALALAVGCSGGVVRTVGEGGGGGDGGAPGVSSAQQSSSTSMLDAVSTTAVVAATSVTTGAGGSPCYSEPDFSACAQCLIYEDPAGYNAFATAYILACGCDSQAMPPSTCLDKCDTGDPGTDFCPSPGQVNLNASNSDCPECINSLRAGDPCMPPMGTFTAYCMADPGCIDFYLAVQGCPGS